MAKTSVIYLYAILQSHFTMLSKGKCFRNFSAIYKLNTERQRHCPWQKKSDQDKRKGEKWQS
jgi:hypothetical protein